MSNNRRDRQEGNDQEAESEPTLTEFQNDCKKTLMEKLHFSQVSSGITFGSHLHCYRNSTSKHEHGEALVLCVENSSASKIDSDLRYLSVASRIANTAKKRFFVAFSKNDGAEDEEKEEEAKEKRKKEIKMVELITIT
jgi:hypothetical protein